jgi:alkanesulfonate monooxygenase SsuD/methylene tetrahydromethanopterin reductase-like flavin-dependent oxidoreductase (luciferase family)
VEFGLFSNGERNNQVAAISYDEDLFEIKLADRLGMREAWISEHLRGSKGSRPDAISAADLFICKAATVTKQIRLGPGVRPIALFQPIQVALEAAVCDHLTRGRYMFGFGVGMPNANDLAQRGLGEDSIPLRRARMHEAIQLIVKCWESPEPFDYDGEFFHGRNIWAVPKPFTKPHMPVGVASSTTKSTMELAARNAFMPMLSQFDNTEHMREHAEAYLAAGKETGHATKRSDMRACRFVYVAESVQRAKEELRETMAPFSLNHVRANPRYYQKFLPPSGNIEDITWDHLVDSGFFFVGDPDTVYSRIRRHYDESGGFGTLLLVVGKDYATRQQRARSLRMFMQEVAPRLRPLSPDVAETREPVATAAAS